LHLVFHGSHFRTKCEVIRWIQCLVEVSSNPWWCAGRMRTFCSHCWNSVFGTRGCACSRWASGGKNSEQSAISSNILRSYCWSHDFFLDFTTDRKYYVPPFLTHPPPWAFVITLRPSSVRPQLLKHIPLWNHLAT
jgi:hypothetical protein